MLPALLGLLVIASGAAWLLLERHERVESARAAAAEVRETTPLAGEAAPRTGLEPASSVSAEPAEASARVESPPVPASAPLEREETLLIIQLVAKESGEPLPGLPVALHLPAGSRSTKPVERSRGEPGESIVSDAAGRAEFVVAAEQAYRLVVNDATPRNAERKNETIAPLTIGEHRELRIALATALDQVWFARIVDGESAAPLANASAERVVGDPFREQRGEVHARSGADGTLALAHGTWGQGIARVELAGYAPAFAALDEGHSDPATPSIVRLLRAASLEGRVLDPSGLPRADVRVALTFESWGQIQGSPWFAFHLEPPAIEARTGADGSCVFEGLPPRVALTLELFEGPRSLRREERALRLEPGERRSVTWSTGASGRVSGRTVDGDGLPVAGVRVWLLPLDPRRGGLLLKSHDRDEVIARAESDSTGRFELSELPAGTWRVGVAPGQKWTPLAVAVEPTPAEQEAEVTLTCWSGLYLSGTVLDPEGQPATQGYVYALGPVILDDDVRPAGTFQIGPLPPGRYRLVASAPGEELSDSEPLTVEAGSEGLVLHLQRGGALALRVLDSRGAPVSGAMAWLLHEEGEGSLGVFTDSSGQASQAGMRPGLYSVSVATPSGEFGIREGLRVVANQPASRVELRLEPACRLRVEFSGKSELRLDIQILRDERVIALVLVREDPVVTVPAGDLEVRLVRYGPDGVEVLQRRDVRAELGGEAVVGFDLAALGR